MMRAGALRRLVTGLLLTAVGLSTSACLLVPVPEPVVGAAVVAPVPVYVAPRPYYHHYYRGGYYGGGYYRGHRWR